VYIGPIRLSVQLMFYNKEHHLPYLSVLPCATTEYDLQTGGNFKYVVGSLFDSTYAFKTRDCETRFSGNRTRRTNVWKAPLLRWMSKQFVRWIPHDGSCSGQYIRIPACNAEDHSNTRKSRVLVVISRPLFTRWRSWSQALTVRVLTPRSLQCTVTTTVSS
jgi:hypothetical protein